MHGAKQRGRVGLFSPCVDDLKHFKRFQNSVSVRPKHTAEMAGKIQRMNREIPHSFTALQASIHQSGVWYHAQNTELGHGEKVK